MESEERTYIAIDLKSFYASVECRERELDPLDTYLVVADEERTDKTICLAVSPALKAYGIPGRCRLFEVKEAVSAINARRGRSRKLRGESTSDEALRKNPSLGLSFIAAKPRMALYIEYSTRIYGIYLRYIAPEDIHVYSIDEVFIDATEYLRIYKTDAESFARMLIKEVLAETGITATAGIGPNLYLAKVAMDIMAKHTKPDSNGARIATLTERSYREKLWSHRPLTDFWRVGRGYAARLESKRLFTMGDIAKCSLRNEEMLYSLFGVNAELLIDHAWGWEPCTMKDIKAYKPSSSSIGSGQVLQCSYSKEKGLIIVKEMADSLALDLVEKGLAANQAMLSIGYDAENILYGESYVGETKRDHYGRTVPKSARGSAMLGSYTQSSVRIIDAFTSLYEKIADKTLTIRRLYLTLNVADELTASAMNNESSMQKDLFDDDGLLQKEEERDRKAKKLQEATLGIKRKFGKNALLRGTSFEDGARGRERNTEIGGHKA